MSTWGCVCKEIVENTGAATTAPLPSTSILFKKYPVNAFTSESEKGGLEESEGLKQSVLGAPFE